MGQPIKSMMGVAHERGRFPSSSLKTEPEENRSLLFQTFSTGEEIAPSERNTPPRNHREQQPSPALPRLEP